MKAQSNFFDRMCWFSALTILSLIMATVLGACGGTPAAPVPSAAPPTLTSAQLTVVTPNPTPTIVAPSSAVPSTLTPAQQTSVTPKPMPTTVAPSSPAPSTTVKTIADDIADKVGRVTQITEGDPTRVVIVFEEVHDSPAGQVEIAVMLNRLYERYGLRYIGLEGAFAKDGNLETAWFQPPPPFEAGQPIREREDVIAQLLEDGEISSSEMLALVYADVAVVGTEDASEYGYELSDEASSAPIIYLYLIAAPGMTQNEIDQANKLIQEDKTKDALEFIISTDTWTSEKYALIKDGTRIISAEEWLQILDDIEAKASKVGAEIETKYKTNLQALRKFYETASQRSRTIVTNTLNLLKKSQAPVATVIGAAHTELIVNLLKEQGVSFAVIRGSSLAENRENGNLNSQAFVRKTLSQSVDTSGALGALLDNRKKPRPVVGEDWFQSKAEIFLLTDCLARAAARGEKAPFVDTVSKLPKFKNVTLDTGSIRMEDNDVIFSVKALNDNGKQVTVWARTRADGEATAKLLEERLLEGHARIQSKKVTTEPESTTSTLKLVTISPETVAKFSTSESEINAVALTKEI